MAEPVALFIKVRTKPGRRDEFHALWARHLRDRALDNPAQRAYCIADGDDGQSVWLFELYADGTALAENAQASWFHEYLAAVEPLLEGPPDVQSAVPKWAKGLTW